MSDTQNQWIPVSERLPEKTVEKLVLLTNGEQWVAFIGGVSGAWAAPGIGPITCVTHWMDLPEPPAPPKPADPFEAWWHSYPTCETQSEAARVAWNAAKEHYAKPMPDFEAWWKSGALISLYPEGPYVSYRIAKIIWNAAQGKPEA